MFLAFLLVIGIFIFHQSIKRKKNQLLSKVMYIVILLGISVLFYELRFHFYLNLHLHLNEIHFFLGQYAFGTLLHSLASPPAMSQQGCLTGVNERVGDFLFMEQGDGNASTSSEGAILRGNPIMGTEAAGSDSGASGAEAHSEPLEPSAKSSEEEPSALEQRTEELLQENLTGRKGDLAPGQGAADPREALKTDFSISNKGEEFLLAKQLEKEVAYPNKESPATSSIFNQVKEFASQRQDGKGGGNPNSCSLNEKEKALVLKVEPTLSGYGKSYRATGLKREEESQPCRKADRRGSL